jgi:hypothetical protein
MQQTVPSSNLTFLYPERHLLFSLKSQSPGLSGRLIVPIGFALSSREISSPSSTSPSPQAETKPIDPVTIISAIIAKNLNIDFMVQSPVADLQEEAAFHF